MQSFKNDLRTMRTCTLSDLFIINLLIISRNVASVGQTISSESTQNLSSLTVGICIFDFPVLVD